ncbi:MAG: hypothetical protein V1708_02845 [Candidatus Micrarchaeota archaeon]
MGKNGISMAAVGGWAFLLGLVIAIGAALMNTALDSGTVLILAILGLLVGVLNISEKEVMTFMVATLVFMIASSSLNVILTALPLFGTLMPAILRNIVVFVAPGAAIVALKSLYDVTKSA